MRAVKMPWIALFSLGLSQALFAHGYSPPAVAYVTLDTGAGDSAFQSVVYVQNLETGETASYPFPPHAPPLLVYIPEAGSYVFYARLIEAMDDYFFACTGRPPQGASPKKGLLVVKIATGKEYRILINDRSVELPEKGKPVRVPVHEE